MKSKYRGKCNTCQAYFPAGAEIRYIPGKGVIACPSCSGELNAMPADSSSPNSVEVRVRIGRITFSKPDGSFMIVKAQFDGEGGMPENCPVQLDKEFDIKGPLGQIRQGDIVSVVGNWENDIKYGLQFKASTMASLAITESEAGLKAFLCRYLPNIGPRRAEEIIREFGGREQVYDMLENNPMDLCKLQGITEERAKQIQQAFTDASGLREIQKFAAELGLTDSMVAKMVDHWGPDAKDMVLEDPYILTELERVGFETADKVARKLKMAGSDPRRCAAATLWLLERSSDDGHTWTTLDYLVDDVEKELKETGLIRADLEKGVEILQKSRKVMKRKKLVELPPRVTVVDGRIYLSAMEQAERRIAEKLTAMLSLSASTETYVAKPLADGATGGVYDGKESEAPKTKNEINDLDDVMNAFSL